VLSIWFAIACVVLNNVPPDYLKLWNSHAHGSDRYHILLTDAKAGQTILNPTSKNDNIADPDQARASHFTAAEIKRRPNTN